ncbi:HAMP domain-containing sensor histidine kinase [Nocardioides sp. LHD-245]|uniref:sensor histidine kinase n=1 Tax=Nocardioides sp. LHD-245 TaxID=3051387 RepID=UPI0027E0E573|nr:HAMP domain-containing sensor histidine kinase [Nocardioides sp. LHD-245]
MSGHRRRALSVRAWFALAAVTIFLVVIVVALAVVSLIGDRSPWATSAGDGEGPVTRLLITTLVIGTAAAIAAFAFSHPFVRPLRAARQAADRVTEGDLTVAPPRSRVTEIDEFGLAFGSMTTALRHSLQQQEALESERRLFIAAIAHDLRTPLFSLRGYLDGLETGLADDPERRRRYLTGANEKARMLDRLVGDLFDYARLEYLDPAPDRRRLDLAELLDDVAEGMRPQAETKRITLTSRPALGPCPVDADRHQLARAINNVLDNALRHAPEDGRVELGCGQAGDAVWLTVHDNGPGIHPDHVPHLFEPLYRADRSSHAGSGTGLGLAITQRIVSAHGGTIAVDNAPADGACFTITLPRPGDGEDRR